MAINKILIKIDASKMQKPMPAPLVVAKPKGVKAWVGRHMFVVAGSLFVIVPVGIWAWQYAVM